MLNPLPPPALPRPIPSSTTSDAPNGSAAHPVPGLASGAGGGKHRSITTLPKQKLLPVKPSKLVGIEVPQADLEKEAEEEARRVKEEQKFEEEFVREKRTNRFEWVRKRQIGAKA